MEIYLVGGAVRDNLLGLAVKDRDYLVVGSTPQQMLDQGFTQVGRDFPVFLHPHTQEEYALARTERKKGQGYTGFICDFDDSITLEQDLIRRDITINAIAQSPNGEIHDPYGGQRDLEQRLLRHVSPAFVEDPLRVLRVARFAARFHHLGFKVADETIALMRDIAHTGELESLTPERVWSELERSLDCQNPQVFFEVLREAEALKVLFPELDELYGVPARKEYHPEICTGLHTMMVLKQAVDEGFAKEVRFAALCHDFGKALTPKDKLPSHPNHGPAGMPRIKAFCERFKVPNHYRDLALLVAEYHITIHSAAELKPATVLKLLNKTDAWRKGERFQQILQACIADYRGRLGWQSKPYPSADYLWLQYQNAQAVDVKAIVAAGYKGAEIREQLGQQRIAVISDTKKAWLANHAS
ncbi:multifunctional CCA addition/repair protein [Aliagarivorans marinus]|uniref:multifunctional CCA addition/repair protein n=1 Tax=Aliagarivorans marinus TaxID=561965 RepID=UPI000405E277|nr:multifunctional CCA addition/repair protein [Aliagarivorans marinus]